MKMSEFMAKAVFPFAAGIFLAALFYPLCQDNGACDYLKLWILVGIPFGIHKMSLWMIPKGFDTGGTVGVLVLNLLAGGVVGSVILAWRLAVAVCYLLKAALSGIGRIAGKRVIQ